MSKAGIAGLWVSSVLLVLAGCAAPPPRTTVNVIGDKFSPGVTLEGLPKEDVFDSNDVFWMLRSVVYPQTHSADHEIYVEWFFPGHGSAKYFAADDTAQPLPVRKILKEDCGAKCGQTDTVGIGIDEATLRARAPTGLQVKLSATDGSSDVLDITPQMIGAQLEAENRVLSASVVPPGAATATAALAMPPSATNASPGSGTVLGISYMKISASQVNPMIYPDGGLFIIVVAPESPAAKAGVKSGDVLLSFDGKPMHDPAAAHDIIAAAKPGSVVKLVIQRGTDRMSVDARL